MVLPFSASTLELISSICVDFSGCFIGDIGFSSSDFSDIFCAEADCTGAGFTDFGGTDNAGFPVSGLKDIGCASSGSLGVGDSSVVGFVSSTLIGSEFVSVGRKLGAGCGGSDCDDTTEFSGIFFLEESVEEVRTPERLLDFASIPAVGAISVVGDCVRISCVAVGLDCTPFATLVFDVCVLPWLRSEFCFEEEIVFPTKFPSSWVVEGRVLVGVGVVDSLFVTRGVMIVLVELDVKGGYEDDAFE
ncbi:MULTISPECIES: hypothetical protein [unclassified Bartonella]|uniref:hypothetical protein n=1 Tax=unclassified Bartonella TaxID=2645622 RepID=UPI0035CFF02E